MTTATEFQSKVDKTSINFDRIDQIVNGSATTDVTVDGGQKVPSFLKLQTAAQLDMAAQVQQAKGSSDAAASARVASEAAARTAALSVASGTIEVDPYFARMSGRRTNVSANYTNFNPQTMGSQGLLGAGVIDRITSYFELPVNGCKYKVLRRRIVAPASSPITDPVSGVIWYDFVAETAPFNAVAGENIMNLDALTALPVDPDCVLAIYTPAVGLSQAGGLPEDSPVYTGLDAGSHNGGAIARGIAGDFKGTAPYQGGNPNWVYSNSMRMLKYRIRHDARLAGLERLGAAYPEGTARLLGAIGPDTPPHNNNVAPVPAGTVWFYNPNSTRSWMVPVDFAGYAASISGYCAVAGRATLFVTDDTGLVIYVEDIRLTSTGRFKAKLSRRVRVKPGYRIGVSQALGARFAYLADGSSQISHTFLEAAGQIAQDLKLNFVGYEPSTVAIQVEVVPLSDAPKQSPRTTLSLGDSYVRGAEVLPVLTDTSRMAGWGSSTMAYIGSKFAGVAQSLGASYFSGGQGGEQMQEHLARLGSHPAQLSGFGGDANLISGSGGTRLLAARGAGTSSGVLLGLGAALLPFTGAIVLPDGTRLAGTLRWNGGNYPEFVRSVPGGDVAVPANAVLPFIPDIGTAHRNALNLLNIGKNNINDAQNLASAEDIVARTHEAFDWLSPLVKRSLVMNHFINTDTPQSDPQYAKTLALNKGLAQRYEKAGLLVDLYAFVCKGTAFYGKTVWQASGVTPTQNDLNQQVAGTKPSSLSRDALHMNDACETAVAWLLRQILNERGWFAAS